MNEPSLNPYKITWITFRPLNGVITKRDQVKLGRNLRYGDARTGTKELNVHFPSEEKAFEHLSKFRELSKEYEFFIYTDKQFGMRKFGEPLEKVLTTKQLSERGVI